jgi:glc operon protein GlcG
MISKDFLAASDAQKIVGGCRAAAHSMGLYVSIAVVDEAGFLIHLERLDGASLQSPEIATLKARTAAISRGATKVLEEVVRDRPATATFPGRLPVQGGLPIVFRGQCVGGVGVSGAKSQEDEDVAKAGLEKWDGSAPS